jgi:hypothetical protein
MEVNDAVWQLLLEKVDSFEKLEVLALVSASAARWTVRTAATQLKLPEPLVQSALLDLSAASLLEKDGAEFRYQPANTELAATSAALVELYNDDRIRVLNVLTSAALDRIRGSAAHAFANAFRLRGKKE